MFFQNMNLSLHFDILNYSSSQKLILAPGATNRDNREHAFEIPF